VTMRPFICLCVLAKGKAAVGFIVGKLGCG